MRIPRDPDVEAIPRSLRIAAGWSWRILGILLLMAAVAAVVIRLQVLFVALFVALLITALLHPGKRLLQRLGLPSIIATALVLLVALTVVLGVFFLAGRALAGQATELIAALSEGLERIETWIEDTIGVSTADLVDSLSGLVQNAGGAGGSIGSGVFGAFATAVEVVAGAGIALFATIFFVHDGPRIWSWVTSLFPAGARGHVAEAGQLSWQTLASYAQATVLIAAIDAIGIGLGVALLGVPLAGPIAVVVFFGAFVPVVGATISGAIAVLIALATEGVTTALLVAGVVLLVQQLEGQVLQPLIQGRFVSIHPLAVVLAVAAGSIVAGLVGAIIAVPIVAVVNVLVRYAARASRPPQPVPAEPAPPDADVPPGAGAEPDAEPDVRRRSSSQP